MSTARTQRRKESSAARPRLCSSAHAEASRARSSYGTRQTSPTRSGSKCAGSGSSRMRAPKFRNHYEQGADSAWRLAPGPAPRGAQKAPYRNVKRENRARGRRERDDCVTPHSTSSSLEFGRKPRPAFADGRPSVSTTSAVKSFEPRISEEPTP